MTQPNWAEAPEGATHYNPFDGYSWWKAQVAGDWMAWTGRKWELFLAGGADRKKMAMFLPRPAEAAAIDWSAAPQGATHYYPADGVFWQITPLASRAMIAGEWRPMTEVSESRLAADFVARPAEAIVWDGHGLPPVGLLVEWNAGSLDEYRRVTVLAYADGEAWIQPDDAPSFIVGNPSGFRPIRTPEKIAAEARAKAIDEMYGCTPTKMTASEVDIQRETCAALYDAGYRKPAELMPEDVEELAQRLFIELCPGAKWHKMGVETQDRYRNAVMDGWIKQGGDA